MRVLNLDTVPIRPGQPVALGTSGGVVRARGDSATTECAALALVSGQPALEFDVVEDGDVTLDDWTAATGSVQLTARSRYYLDPSTAGKLTTTAPSTAGQILQLVGVALDNNTLRVDLRDAIQL